jgi:hypothetical protein
MCGVGRNVWGGGSGDVGGGMSVREVVVMSGGGCSLTLGERMRQALERDTTFFPAARVSGKAEMDENTAGCGDVDSEIGARAESISGKVLDRVVGAYQHRRRRRAGVIDRRRRRVSCRGTLPAE